ncbi:MAG: alpha/beta hydrolase [Pigmentiphaga sp.]|nr:alpha/beta hydrolase [Pigmentiphaga sp.]
MKKAIDVSAARVASFRVPGPAAELAVYVQGDPEAPAVFMTHSILSSSMMWEAEAALLATQGWRVIRADTRGHGRSGSPPLPCGMEDLVADTVAVLDALNLARVHYVGLSLGGMSGFGLALDHGDRLLSMCLCDARADMPEALHSAWHQRIASAQESGTASLAGTTIERWFGKEFVSLHPDIAARFMDQAGATSVDGFVGCAQAILGLNYLPRVSGITVPTTLIVGANDQPLPAEMKNIQALIPGSGLAVIPDAGHLPNIDQPVLFQQALLRHFENHASPGDK